MLCLRLLDFVWSSGIGGMLWPVVGPQQIYESLQHDRSRCFNFWIGGFFFVVSREISLRDKLSFFCCRLFQVVGTPTLSVVALLEHELLCTCGFLIFLSIISITTCVSQKFVTFSMACHWIEVVSSNCRMSFLIVRLLFLKHCYAWNRKLCVYFVCLGVAWCLESFHFGRDFSFHGSATFDVSLFVQHIQCMALVWIKELL